MENQIDVYFGTEEIEKRRQGLKTILGEIGVTLANKNPLINRQELEDEARDILKKLEFLVSAKTAREVN